MLTINDKSIKVYKGLNRIHVSLCGRTQNTVIKDKFQLNILKVLRLVFFIHGLHASAIGKKSEHGVILSASNVGKLKDFHLHQREDARNKILSRVYHHWQYNTITI